MSQFDRSSGGEWDQAGHVLEALEPRVLLTALVYDGLPAYFELPGTTEGVLVDGANEDLSFVFSSFETGARPQTGFALIDGVRTDFADLPGVGDDAYILGVNNAGLIVGAERGEPGMGSEPVLGRLFVVLGGMRVYLDDAAGEVIGGQTPDFATFAAAEEGTPDGPLVPVGNDGSVLLHDLDEDGRRRAWVLKDGVLTFLWYGEAQDVNDLGTVLGTQRGEGDSAVLQLREVDGELTVVGGLSPLRTVALNGAVPPSRTIMITAAVNNLGEVYGQDPSLRLAVWRDGEVTPLSAAPTGPLHYEFGWVVQDADDDGRVIAVYYRFQQPSGIPGDVGSVVESSRRFLPGEGLASLQQDLWGVGNQQPPGGALRLASDDRILLSTGVLSTVEDREVWMLAPGTPIGTTADSVIGVSRFGDLIWFQREGDTWSGSRVSTGSGIGAPPASARGKEVTRVHAYTDPRDGRDYFFVLGPELRAWGSDANIGIRTSEGTTNPYRNATVFTASGNRIILAGQDAAGDLAIYYQTGRFAPGTDLNWNYDNLVTSHLQPQGLSLPTIASNLTAFSTPWGSDHIGFLDDAGQLHVVWIPPGGTQWQIVNLSEIAGAPPLSGTLSSFITPWETLHFNAVDADGNAVAVWWAPGFGPQWASTRLFGQAPEITLRPESITAFTTPWGALNLVGIDADTGQTAVYWWAPETDEWRAEPIVVLPAAEGGPVPPPVGSLRGGSRPDGQDVFGATADNELVRLLWNVGDGAAWTIENLSEQVS